MTTSTDTEYKNAKLIKQGKQTILPEFKELADWISKKYNVNVINIYHELMTNKNKIRLAIVVEFEEEYLKFKEDDKQWSNYDEKIQNEIAEKYIKFNQVWKLNSKKKFLGLIKKQIKLKTNDIFVSTSAFEPIAKEEANKLIPENKIKELLNKINRKEIWTLSRCFDSSTLFVFKDEQKSKIKNSDFFTEIEDRYFNTLKEYDEFNYWKREKFKIEIDSKQNFDDNYESSWFYYYR